MRTLIEAIPIGVIDLQAENARLRAELGGANHKTCLAAEIRQALKALRDIGSQLKTSEMSGGQHADGDFEGAYDTMIEVARAALAKHEEPKA